MGVRLFDSFCVNIARKPASFDNRGHETGNSGDWLSSAINDKVLIAAIEQSSPEFGSELKKARKSGKFEKRVLDSLRNYMVRISTRTEPFGLFVTVAIGKFGVDNDLVYAIREDEQKWYPDHNGMAVGDHEGEGLWLNPTLNRSVGCFRYFSSTSKGDYILKKSTIESPALENLRKIEGKGKGKILEHLLGLGLTRDRAEPFLSHLCSSGILVGGSKTKIDGAIYNSGTGEGMGLVDTFNRKEFIVSNDVRDLIERGIQQVIHFGEENNPVALDDFTNAFVRRFEGAPVGLLDALDPVSGLGYPPAGYLSSSHLGDPRHGEPKKKDLGGFYGLLLENLLERPGETIRLRKSEITSVVGRGIAPESTATAFCQIFIEGNNTKVYIEKIMGLTASRYISRFAEGHSGINDLYHEICEYESGGTGINAELVFKDRRVDMNLGFRPIAREYVIELDKGLIGDGYKSIPLRELTVRMRNNELHLFWENRRVDVFSSTSQFIGGSNRPLLRFLNDLQSDRIRSRRIRWGDISRFHRNLPRVEFNNLVLIPRTWILAGGYFRKLCSLKDRPRRFSALWSEWCDSSRIHDCFRFVLTDVQIVIYRRDADAIRNLFHRHPGHDRFVFVEFFGDKSIVVDELGNRHASRLLVPFKLTSYV